MILLDALHINNSGGKVLLDYLIAELHATGRKVFYLLDERVAGSYPFLPAGQALYLPAGLWARYRFYRQQRGRFRAVLCFGNIPPPLRLSCPVFTYFHNVLFLDIPAAFPIQERLILSLKAHVIRWLSGHTAKWWVQSEEVRQMLSERLAIHSTTIAVMPFFPPVPVGDLTFRQEGTFLYVSEGHPHKQHLPLLEAFELLHLEAPQVRLRLTISGNYPVLLKRIEAMNRRGIPVENLGWIPTAQLAEEYARNQFLVYPSIRESFGLGLVEASQAGLPIIAADRPYVHAVVEPFLVFDPERPLSIYQSLREALNKVPQPSTLKVENRISEMLHSLTPCAA